MRHASRLTLGTAQLGLDYGIANPNGKPRAEEAVRILEVSLKNGITSFDTAYQYGDSEKVIGSYISGRADKSSVPMVISKLPAINEAKLSGYDDVYKEVKKYVNGSLRRLALDKIPVYFLHSAKDMDSYDGMVLKSLRTIKEEGLIGAVGTSVYYPEEAERALEVKEIEVLQIPVNLFDHRFLKNDLLKRLSDKNKMIFVRSVFLQGLFFMDPEKLPRGIKTASGYLEKLRDFSSKENIDIDALALGFVKSFPEVASMVIGAESEEQVLKNIKLLDAPEIDGQLKRRILEEFGDIDEEIILPTKWKLEK